MADAGLPPSTSLLTAAQHCALDGVQKRQVTALISLRNKKRKAAAMNENKVPLQAGIK
jgi:hypothetical protein